MERTIVGLEAVKYVSKKTNLPVEGINLHCTGKSANVKGVCAERYFISIRSEGLYNEVAVLQPNDVVNLEFNRFGNIEGVTFIKK
jgi:hypothetical protein